MKLNIHFGVASLFLSALCAHAEISPSPDGKFKLDVGKQIEVQDASGQSLILLDENTTGLRNAHVAWSADSNRVVVVENYDRGSAVFAAWHNGSVWHKTLETDADQEALFRPFRKLGAPVAEHRSLENWVSADSIIITGERQFQNGQHLGYAYTLSFLPSPGHLDRGGYEEGAIHGTNYRTR